jgi:hypothetical protein
MKHLEAIGRAILRPLLMLLQRDSLATVWMGDQ